MDPSDYHLLHTNRFPVTCHVCKRIVLPHMGFVQAVGNKVWVGYHPRCVPHPGFTPMQIRLMGEGKAIQLEMGL